ncbi:type III secretion system effector secretion,LEE associated [Edwardsiella piscicida]|nr:type III secretion system effector secretion,LEE associated [Edwardsiella piscicida]
MELLGEEEWELALLAWLGVGGITHEKLKKIKNLYQKAKDQEDYEGSTLLTWFLEIKDLPDRDNYLKVIIRALSFELSYLPQVEDRERTSSVITDLYRIIVFLSLNNYSEIVSLSLKKDADIILSELISTLEQTWLTEEWFAGSPSRVGVIDGQKLYYYHLIKDFYQTLPHSCFMTEEQRESIINGISDVIDRDSE